VQLNNQAKKNLKNVHHWDTVILTPPLLTTAFPGVWILEANPLLMYYNTVNGARYEQEGDHIQTGEGKGPVYSVGDEVYQMNMPFKGQDQFFGGFEGVKEMRPTSIGPEDPNILHGLATPQPPTLESESLCSQGFSAEGQDPIPKQDSVSRGNEHIRGRQDTSGRTV
jgi:hypothetical protein